MRFRKLLMAIVLSLASTRVAAQGGTIGGSSGGSITGATFALGTWTGGAASLIVTAGTGTSRTMTLQTTTSAGTAKNTLVLGADTSARFLGSVLPAVTNVQSLGVTGTVWKDASINAVFANLGTGTNTGFSFIGQTGEGIHRNGAAIQIQTAAAPTLEISGGVTPTLTGGAGSMTLIAGTGASRTLTLQSSNSSSAATTFAVGSGDTIKLTHGIAASLTAASGTPHAMCLDPTTHEMEDNAALTCTVSARRFKRDIASLSTTEAKRIVMALKPSTFAMRSGNRKSIGLIAEEVDSVDARLTFRDDKGQLNSVDYQALGPILVRLVQDQQRQLDALAGVQPDSTIGPLKKHVNVNNALALLGLVGAVGGVGGVVAARRRPSLRIDFRA